MTIVLLFLKYTKKKKKKKRDLCSLFSSLLPPTFSILITKVNEYNITVPKKKNLDLKEQNPLHFSWNEENPFMVKICSYVYIQGQRHLKVKVVLGPPWLELFFFIYNNLKKFICLPFKKNLGTPSVFFMPIKLNFTP